MVGSTPPGKRMSRRQQEAQRAAVEDGALIDTAYYQSMLMNHNAPLFGRTHQRMLRALYPPTQASAPAALAPPAPSSPQQQPPQPEEGDEIWGRVNAFLDDAGGLMALRVQLLATRAAEPWMAPLPVPAAAAAVGGGGRQGAASSTTAAAAAAPSEAMRPPSFAPATIMQGSGGGGNLGLGWRLAGRCLHDQHQHAYGRFRRRCQAHGPLLQAIEAEIRRLAAAFAAVDHQQQPPPPPVAMTRAGAVVAPPVLAQQLAVVDGAVLLESRLALWRRLRESVLAVVTVVPGENLAAVTAEGSGGVDAGQGQGGPLGASEASSMMVVVEE